MSTNKLGDITINGKTVSVFEPPHADPDFPWVDVEELAKAFLPRSAAKRMVRHVHQFDGDARRYATAKNGDRIATIICHAMAQGLCGAIDQWNGSTEDEGPAHRQYCLAFGVFARHWPMSFEDMFHAFAHPGGQFMKDATA